MEKEVVMGVEMEVEKEVVMGVEMEVGREVVMGRRRGHAACGKPPRPGRASILLAQLLEHHSLRPRNRRHSQLLVREIQQLIHLSRGQRRRAARLAAAAAAADRLAAAAAQGRVVASPELHPRVDRSPLLPIEPILWAEA